MSCNATYHETTYACGCVLRTGPGMELHPAWCEEHGWREGWATGPTTHDNPLQTAHDESRDC